MVRMGVPPSQGWGTPWTGMGAPPAWDWVPLTRDRTADGVLDTWQAVCLLCSRRRTFLFGSKVG